MSVKISTILKAWLIVGTLDITGAIISYYIQTGKNPLFVLEYVASAVLGKSAFEGGGGTMLLGLCLHFAVAFLFTLFFFFILKYGLLSIGLK